MKRQKSFKKLKLNFGPLTGAVKKFIDRQLPNIVVVVIFLIVVLFCVKAFFDRSDYFQVRAIEAKGFADGRQSAFISDELLKVYKHKNIFRVNIGSIADYLRARYPDAKEVIVKRELPDKLTLLLYFRRPVALVSDSRYYPVDDDGVIIRNVDPRTLQNLPIITGLGMGYNGTIVKSSQAANLRLALTLLRDIKKMRFLNVYYPLTVNAADTKNLSFYLKNGVEVRIGSENFRDRLAILKKTLKNPRLLLDRIKYIDMRFKDVVIGPR